MIMRKTILFVTICLLAIGMAEAQTYTLQDVTLTGTASEGGADVTLQQLRPNNRATGIYEAYVRLQPGTFTFRSNTSEGDVVTLGQGNTTGVLTVGGEPFTVSDEQVVRLRVNISTRAFTMTPVKLYVKGNIAPAGTTIAYVGDGKFEQQVTLDDSGVFLFSDKFIYFAFNDNDQLAVRRLTSDRTRVGMPSEGYQAENIRINGGTYTFTVDMKNLTWNVDAPIDEYKVSAFGSSVCNGQGADGFRGYAYMYGQQLQERYADTTSPYPFYTSGISIGGNNTQNLLDRYDEQQHNFSRYVVIGLSLGNEGIHESGNKQQTLNQFSTNLQRIVSKIKDEGKVPVVMNSYTRGDFTLTDYNYVRQMNMQIHEWDVASVNTLGAIDDGTGKWATGYQLDNAHPTTAGHREFFYAIPPSLFDALKGGKAQPVRNTNAEMVLSGGHVITFRGEGTVHPFTLSVRFKGNAAGRVFAFRQTIAGRQSSVSINNTGHALFTYANGTTLASEAAVASDTWHTVTVTHYFAQGRLLFYLDKTCVGEISTRVNAIRDVIVGDGNADVSRTVGEVFFWRAGMNADEIAAVVDGKLLKSSLEVYVPTVSATSLDNLAMSLNSVSYADHEPDESAGESTVLSSPFEGTTIEAGQEFYLYNVETGMWLQENNRFSSDWNTHGELGDTGFDVAQRSDDERFCNLSFLIRGNEFSHEDTRRSH